MKQKTKIEQKQKAKLQALVKMEMTRNQPTTFQNRRIFRELKSVTFAKLPLKLIRQILVSTCSRRSLNTPVEHMCAAGLAGPHPGLQDGILLNYTRIVNF